MLIPPTSDAVEISESQAPWLQNFRPENDPENVQRTRNLNPEEVDQFLQGTNEVLWTEWTRDWRSQIGACKHRISDRVHDLLHNCDMFESSTPMRITPSISSCVLSTDMRTTLDKFLAEHGSNSFAFWSHYWPSNIDQGESLVKPDLKVLDILCFTDNHVQPLSAQPLSLWLVSEVVMTKEEIECCWIYLRLSARLTKKHLIQSLRDHGLLTSECAIHTSIDCHIYNASNGKIPRAFPLDSLHGWFTDSGSGDRDTLRTGLALMLFKKNTSLKIGLNDRILLQLSYEQSQNMQAMLNAKFNFIEGPPGSGKTITAFYLCDYYGPEHTQYICNTSQFKAFVDYQEKAETHILKPEEQLSELISAMTLKKCLIIDDLQALFCTQEDWLSALDIIVKCPEVRFYIFVDCNYQNFMHRDHTNILRESFSAFCDERAIRYNKLHLNEIHRNTRKLASFMVASFPGDDRVTCAHDEEGGGVEIIRLPNLMSAGDDNGLLSYLEKIAGYTTKNPGQSYAPEQIAILVDDIVGADQVTLFSDMINAHFQFKAHDASVYPRTGIVVESLDNFVGLDAQLIIFPFSNVNLTLAAKLAPNIPEHIGNTDYESIPDADLRVLANSRYKTFIASRAIHRVVFVTEDVLNHQVADVMKLDNLPTRHPHDVTTSDSTDMTSEDDLDLEHPMEISGSDDSVEHRRSDYTCYTRKLLVVCGQKCCDTKEVGQLLEKGADVNDVNEYGQTALYTACMYGLQDVAVVLVNHGAELDPTGRKPLCVAARQGHPQLVQWLLEKGAAVNAVDEAGRTALYRACEGGDLSVVELLIQHGVNIDLGRDKPLVAVTKEGNVLLVEALLKRDADVNVMDALGCTALHTACAMEHSEVAEMLINYGANVNLGQKKPLIVAAGRGLKDLLIKMISKGADVNIVDGEDDTALYTACDNGHQDIAAVLLQHGARTDSARLRPLIIAAERGSRSLLELLLDNGADIDTLDKTGRSAFHAAYEKHHTTLAKLLFERGASLEVGGLKPLVTAAEHGDVAMLRWLLNKGADVNAENDVGESALFAACRRGNGNVAELLFKRGAKLEKVRHKSLIAAAIERKRPAVRWLLNKGADVNELDEKGHTVLWHVQSQKRKVEKRDITWKGDQLREFDDMEKFLRDSGAHD